VLQKGPNNWFGAIDMISGLMKHIGKLKLNSIKNVHVEQGDKKI